MEAEPGAGEVNLDASALAFLESLGDGFYMLDESWRFVAFCDRCEDYSARSRRDVLGQTFTEVFPQLRDSPFERTLAKTLETGAAQRVEAVSPLTGNSILLRAFPSEGGVTAVFTDVGKSRATERALRSSELRYRTLFDSLDEGFCVVEMIFDANCRPVDYRFIEINPAFTRQTGLGDVIGRTIREFAPEHEAHWFELYGEVARTGKSARCENRSSALGERWYDVSAFRFGAAEDRRVGVLFSDVTARREAADALRELNEALETRVAERTRELQDSVRELEAFNYSVSHDLRSPLRTVAGTASILLDEVGPELSSEHRHLLDRQIANARRMGTILDELLRLSRLSRAEVNRAPLDVTAKVRKAWEARRAAFPTAATLEVQEGMRAEADPQLVRTLLEDLIDNALKFSPQGGTVRVAEIDGVFSVSDEGVGFDMAHADKIFLPFERLVRDSEFPGTGVGLANVQRIVRRHGGRVRFESEPGRGATFWFTLSSLGA